MNTSTFRPRARGTGPIPAAGEAQSHTRRAFRQNKNPGLVLLPVALWVAVVQGQTSDGAWPPFLGSRAAYPADVVADVERVWVSPTLTRTVRGELARVPFELYAALVDAPEVTAAAARFLGLARYEVEALADGWYRATDHDGARGVYRVLVRESTRRVMLSRGEHAGALLGRIHGSALTVLEFTPTAGGVQPELTALVRIDNPVAAALARVLVAIFGYVADRKLSEGFVVTARVAEWAMEQPREFCEWLAQEPLPVRARERVAAALGRCP